MKLRKRKTAFTLVELLVVILIVGILFVALVARTSSVSDRTKRTGIIANMRSYQLALETVGMENQCYYSDLEKMASMLNAALDPDYQVTVDDGYLVSRLEDPYGTCYRMNVMFPRDTMGAVSVASAGRDKDFDTDDDYVMTVICDTSASYLRIVTDTEGTYDLTAHDHIAGEWYMIVVPTCTAEGKKEAKCTICDEAMYAPIPKTAHVEVVDASVAATCTQTGLTDGLHCQNCGTIIRPQTVVPALGHLYDNGTVTTVATCVVTGKTEFKCTRTGMVLLFLLCLRSERYQPHIS